MNSELAIEKIHKNIGEDNKPCDAIFMTLLTVNRFVEYHREQNIIGNEDEFQLRPMAIESYGYAGEMSGIKIFIYDKDNEKQQLLDYALKFRADTGREPHILKVN